MGDINAACRKSNIRALVSNTWPVIRAGTIGSGSFHSVGVMGLDFL